MTNFSYDFVIAGAGVIGLTIARAILKKHAGAKLIILEKESCLGVHASGRNSGILHTGIYYPANTLKAKFCKKGADLLFTYAQKHEIPVRKDGKVIVATSEENAAGLKQLMCNAEHNDINAELLNESELNEIEPHAFAQFGGIYCQDTAVIDAKKVLVQLEKDIEELGGEISFENKLLSIDDEKKEIITSSTKMSYGYFINAAGAFSDRIAKMASVGDEFRLVPFKGLYYKMSEKYASRIKSSIYPVPDASLPFLGIHFTRSIEGEVYVGPTTVPALGRENYRSIEGFRFNEFIQIFHSLSKLYMANSQNFRNLVHKELPHYMKQGFLNSAKKLVDELQFHWLEASPKVGIRPQLVNTKENKLETDFIVREGKNSLHILNSISPAFTSSFAVAENIVENYIN